jgi:transcriptional regulator with XRE-family HTH domain
MGATKNPSAVFAQRLAAERKRKKWTAQRLSEETKALGGHLSRGTIAKLESRDRPSVTLDEAVLLAVALDVPLPLMFLPIEEEGEVALTPTTKVYCWQAWEWFHGQEPLPGGSLDGAWPASAYSDVQDARKEAEAARFQIASAEYEEDEHKLQGGRRNYVAALGKLDRALRVMENSALPTSRLLNAETAEDMYGLRIRRREN